MKSYTRNLAGFIALILATFSLFFFTAVRLIRGVEFDAVKDKAESKIEVVSNNYKNYLESINQELNAVGLLSTTSKEKLGEYLWALRRSNPAYRELAFFDRYGRLLFNTDTPSLIDRTFLKLAKNAPVVRRINKQSYLVLRREIKRDEVKQGEIIAVIDAYHTRKWLGEKVFLWVDGQALLTGSPKLPARPEKLRDGGVARTPGGNILAWRKVGENTIVATLYGPVRYSSLAALIPIFIFLLSITIFLAVYITNESFRPYKRFRRKMKELSQKSSLSLDDIKALPHDANGLSFFSKILLSSCYMQGQHYRCIVSALELPVFLLDNRGIVSDINDELARRVGRVRDEIVGKCSLQELLGLPRPIDVPALFEGRKQGEAGEMIFKRVVIRNREGERFPMGLWLGRVSDDAMGQVRDYFGFLTELKGKVFIAPPDFDKELALISENIESYKKTMNWQMLVTSESSPMFELVQRLNGLGKFLNRNRDELRETAVQIGKALRSVRRLLKDIKEATLEPTGRAAVIAGRIGEIAGSTEEIEESAKMVKDVTSSVENLVEEQLLEMTQSFPLLSELTEDLKLLNGEGKRLSNIILSARALLKGLEDKLWGILDEVTGGEKRREFEQFFRSQHELSSLMETATGSVDAIRADIQDCEHSVKLLETELKRLNTYMLNFHGTLKRLAGLVEQLLSIADGSSWNVEDLRHEVENISSANWSSTSFIQEVLEELDRLESALQKFTEIINAESERVKRAKAA